MPGYINSKTTNQNQLLCLCFFNLIIVIFIGSEQGRKTKIYFPFLNPNYPIILLSLSESMFGLRRIFVFHLHWLSSQVSVKRCQNQAILSTFRFLGVKMLNLFLINFLAKSDNSKYFSFFIFFKKNKIVVTMLAWHLQK